MKRATARLVSISCAACAAIYSASCGGEGARSAATPPPVRVDVSPASTPTNTTIVSSAAARPVPPPSALSLSPEAPPPPDPVYCGGKCAGGPNNALVDALGKRATKAHRCYDNELARDPTLLGRVIVKMRIGSDGRMCTVTAVPAEAKMDPVATCVAGYFRGAVGGQSLPAPSGGCAELNLPIAFVPKGDAGAP